MKINITVEATAREVREALGLPDVRPLQEKLLQEATKRMQSGLSNMDVLQLVKPMVSAAVPSTDALQKLLWSAWPLGGSDVDKTTKKDKS